MRTPAFSARTHLYFLMLFIGSHLPLTGCNDESKTSGTQVQVSEEAKAHLKAKESRTRGDVPRTRPRPPVRRSSRSQTMISGSRSAIVIISISTSVQPLILAVSDV